MGNWLKLGIPVIAVIILFNFGNYNFVYPLTPPPLDRELTDVEKKCLSEGWDDFRIGKVLSPKMQIFCGASLENVTCNEGLELIFKATNGFPACVKPSTATKLVERGWGTNTPLPIPIESTVEEEPEPEPTPIESPVEEEPEPEPTPIESTVEEEPEPIPTELEGTVTTSSSTGVQ